MIYSIENNKIKVEVNSDGAELWSMQNKSTGSQHIWTGEKDIWPRRSPTLFPICGKLLEDSYTFKGKEYHLLQHGFMRDCSHKLVEQTDNSLHFCFESTPETMEIYPFNFEFHTRYILEESELSYSFEVVNTGDDNMFFSVGFHTGFAIPFSESGDFADYSLVFEQPETVTRLITEGQYLTKQTETYMNNEQEIPLTDGMFGDSVALKDLKSEYISVNNNKTNEEIKVDIKGFPYVLLWSYTKGMPYICIEPWYGLPDYLDHNSNIEDKAGIINLDSKNKFYCCQTIELT